jgi:FkbM family methyltransferase
MYDTRRTAAFAVDVMCRVAGRRNVVRAARFALNCARIDFGFDMHLNGEFALQGWILDLLPGGGGVHVVDVGANVGEWSRPLLDLAESRGRLDELDLHAFEPCAETFRQLTESIGNSSASLQQVALSDHAGEVTLHISPGRSYLNSFHAMPGRHTAEEAVTTTTLDAYAQRTHLSRIDLLKIDAEGHDLAVLKGASDLLRDRRIGTVLFEYNDSWIFARHYIQDVYDLLEPLGYQLGKLTPWGIEFYPRWNSGLETFREAMYVACRKDVAERLPYVAERHSLARIPGVTA